MSSIEPDLITNLVWFGISSFLVIVSLHSLLTPFQSVMSLFAYFIKTSSEFFNGFSSDVRYRFDTFPRMSSMGEVEGGGTGCRCGSSFCEFSEGKPITPVILSLVNEKTEISFDFLVHSFSLAISLRVISCGRETCDAE